MEKPKQAEIYERLASLGHALSNAHRLKMLQLLSHGEKTVDQLANETGQSLAAASANLKILRGAALVIGEKRGRSVVCRLSEQKVEHLWLHLRDLGELILPEVREIMREHFYDPEEVSSFTVEQLNRELNQAERNRNEFTLLDLRPEEEYNAGHLPQAQNIPFAELESSHTKLAKRRPLLVYCRGPFCDGALAGNRWLRKNRFRCQRLRFSVPEWKAAGLQLEVER